MEEHLNFITSYLSSVCSTEATLENAIALKRRESQLRKVIETVERSLATLRAQYRATSESKIAVSRAIRATLKFRIDSPPALERVVIGRDVTVVLPRVTMASIRPGCWGALDVAGTPTAVFCIRPGQIVPCTPLRISDTRDRSQHCNNQPCTRPVCRYYHSPLRYPGSRHALAVPRIFGNFGDVNALREQLSSMSFVDVSIQAQWAATILLMVSQLQK